jgi:hypothetical protein
MDCIVKYICKKVQIGTLVYHNVKINDEMWHYPGSENPPLTEEEVVSLAENSNCNNSDLVDLGFVKGWVKKCD